MARKVTFATRVGRVRRAIQNGDVQRGLKELMILGLEANEPEDYKLSPRTLYDMLSTLKKLREQEGAVDDGEETEELDEWLKDEISSGH